MKRLWEASFRERILTMGRAVACCNYILNVAGFPMGRHSSMGGMGQGGWVIQEMKGENVSFRAFS